MTDSERLDLIFSEIQGMKSDMQGMKSDMQGMKSDMQGMKSDMQGMKSEIQGMKSDMQGMKSEIQGMKSDMQGMKSDIQELKQSTTNIKLHIENCTDKNIQLIAENFIELTKKLNQAIPVADKNLAYEVKVNYLIEKVQVLENEITEIKNSIA